LKLPRRPFGFSRNEEFKHVILSEAPWGEATSGEAEGSSLELQ
jgi:hypothetical protein